MEQTGAAVGGDLPRSAESIAVSKGLAGSVQLRPMRPASASRQFDDQIIYRPAAGHPPQLPTSANGREQTQRDLRSATTAVFCAGNFVCSRDAVLAKVRTRGSTAWAAGLEIYRCPIRFKLNLT